MDLWRPFDLEETFNFDGENWSASITQILTISFFQGILVPKAAKSCVKTSNIFAGIPAVKKGRLVERTRGTKCLDQSGSQHEKVTLVLHCLHHTYIHVRKREVQFCKLDITRLQSQKLCVCRSESDLTWLEHAWSVLSKGVSPVS